METALKDPRKTEINSDFHVSTALFASRFETRLFSTIDEVPAELVTLITQATDMVKVLDTKCMTTDTNTRYEEGEGDDYPYCACGCDSEYDPYEDAETYVTGLSIETYAFKDSNTVHDMLVAVVQEYVNTRKRTVSYV